MWNLVIPTFILNLLGKNKGTDVQKLNCVICDACRKVIGQGHGEYYMIASKEYCSLTCYYEGLVVKKASKRKKGKK